MDYFLFFVGLFLLLSVGLLIWQFLGYPVFMGMIKKHSKTVTTDDQYSTGVTIIIPTYNESKNIIARIKNIMDQDYPMDNVEIFIVDSGSTDDTEKKINEFVETSGTNKPQIRMIQEGARKGKGSAINLGVKYSTKEIILVSDANSIFDRDVLKRMMPYFKDPKVGAVDGRFMISNDQSELPSSTQFYWAIESIMREGETRLDSSCLFHGEINAWRKGIVEADTRMLSEDFDMAIRIRSAGYKIVYEPRAVVREPAPTNKKDQIIQKRRTAVGTLLALIKNWRFLIKPTNYYTTIIMPSHKTLAMISPFLIFSSLILFILSLYYYPLYTLYFLVIFFGISLLLGAILFKMLGQSKDNNSHSKSHSSLWSIVKYIVLNEYIVLLAWYDLASHKYSVLWEKVESTR